MSAQFAVGEFSTVSANARAEASRAPVTEGIPQTDTAYAQGALVAASVAPGMAPFVAARVGLGFQFEGGLTYTGRAARVDARRSFALSEETDLSLGLGLSAPLLGRESGSLPNVDLSKLRGYGADIPLLVGWESLAGLYKVWGGVRGEYEHVSLDDVTSDPIPGAPSQTIPLRGDRIGAMGVVGLSVGFRFIHVALEFDAGYAYIHGTFNGTSASVSGLVLSPGAAIGWDF